MTYITTLQDYDRQYLIDVITEISERFRSSREGVFKSDRRLRFLTKAMQRQLEALDLMDDERWTEEITQVESNLNAKVGEKDASYFLDNARKRRRQMKSLTGPPIN